MQVVLLAGGKGERLRPLTLCIPKPLIPIDDTPVLELLIRQLKNYGFTDFTLCLNYLSDIIMAYFKGGEKLGVNIKYSIEEEYLGTAGPLSIIEGLEETFIVSNSDLLTNINYKDLIKYHLDNKNDATIATFKKDFKIDLGVIETNNGEFIDYVEKPTYYHYVSMGIYVLNRSVIDLIPKNTKTDFPELIMKMKETGKKVGCFCGDYLWLDIGRNADYEEAIRTYKERKGEFLPNG